MARTINAPDDILNYPKAQIVYRKQSFKPGHPQAPLATGGRVIECQWDIEYELDENGDETATVLHAAESVSFAETEGGWDKATSMRLG